MNKLIETILYTSILGTSSIALADNDFDDIGNLSQDDFSKFSGNLGAATSYKAVSPAEPLGLLGFDIAFELTATDLDKELFKEASSDWELDYLPVPKIHIHKGLPFNLDIGAFYSQAPETEISLWGGELRYSFVTGNTLIPAMSIRATYSRLEGIDQLELSNKGVEFSISKGLAIFTPYAGVGLIRTESEAVDETNLDKETIDESKLFAGLNINFGLNLGFEIDITGDTTSYSAKAGIRF